MPVQHSLPRHLIHARVLGLCNYSRCTTVSAVIREIERQREKSVRQRAMCSTSLRNGGFGCIMSSTQCGNPSNAHHPPVFGQISLCVPASVGVLYVTWAWLSTFLPSIEAFP